MEQSVAGALEADVKPILENDNPLVKDNTYEVIVHTPNEDLTVDLLDSIEKFRDFANNLSDYIIVKFIMYGENFTSKIFPFRDNLEMSITVTDSKGNVDTERYKFTLTSHGKNVDQDPLTKSGEYSNNASIHNVEGQCTLRELESIRASYCEGVYQSCNVEDSILEVLTAACKDCTVEGSTVSPKIDIYKANNDKVYNHIIVPTGTPSLAYPSFLQNTNYGVYNGNIGTYVTFIDDKLTISVFPLYNDEIFDDGNVKKKLMIFSLNNSRMNLQERTFLQDGDILKVLCTSDVQTSDSGDNRLIDIGSGVINSNPYLTQNRNISITNDKMSYDSTAQLSTSKVKDKKDGVNKALYVGDQANMYKVRSDFNKMNQAVYTVKWNNSNIDLLTPGMPVCFIYEDKVRGIVELKGVVQTAYEMYSKRNQSTTSILNISIAKPINDSSTDNYSSAE